MPKAEILTDSEIRQLVRIGHRLGRFVHLASSREDRNRIALAQGHISDALEAIIGKGLDDFK